MFDVRSVDRFNVTGLKRHTGPAQRANDRIRICAGKPDARISQRPPQFELLTAPSLLLRERFALPKVFGYGYRLRQFFRWAHCVTGFLSEEFDRPLGNGRPNG